MEFWKGTIFKGQGKEALALQEEWERVFEKAKGKPRKSNVSDTKESMSFESTLEAN